MLQNGDDSYGESFCLQKYSCSIAITDLPVSMTYLIPCEVSQSLLAGVKRSENGLWQPLIINQIGLLTENNIL